MASKGQQHQLNMGFLLHEFDVGIAQIRVGSSGCLHLVFLPKIYFTPLVSRLGGQVGHQKKGNSSRNWLFYAAHVILLLWALIPSFTLESIFAYFNLEL